MIKKPMGLSENTKSTIEYKDRKLSLMKKKDDICESEIASKSNRWLICMHSMLTWTVWNPFFWGGGGNKFVNKAEQRLYWPTSAWVANMDD